MTGLYNLQRQCFGLLQFKNGMLENPSAFPITNKIMEII